jgi:hypothetical protein
LEGQKELAKQADDVLRKSKIGKSDLIKRNKELEKEIRILKVTKIVKSEAVKDVNGDIFSYGTD